MYTKNELTEAFNHLDNLRETNRMNMFLAAPVLVELMSINQMKACGLLNLWMDYFDDAEVSVRVDKVIFDGKDK